jgi:hypothetical protein
MISTPNLEAPVSVCVFVTLFGEGANGYLTKPELRYQVVGLPQEISWGP